MAASPPIFLPLPAPNHITVHTMTHRVFQSQHKDTVLQTSENPNKTEIHRLQGRRHRCPSLREVIARKKLYQKVLENVSWLRRAFFIFRLNTHTHNRPRLDMYLYIYSLKDSMENFRNGIFCLHKLLALTFQLGFDSTVSLIGIWYQTLYGCPIYVTIFSSRMKATLVEEKYWQHSENFSYVYICQPLRLNFRK